MASTSDLAALLRAFEDAVASGVDRTIEFMASPAGQQLRAIAARGLVLATPMILRHPFFRTPLGRVIEIGGAAALVAKAASIIRDWEPAPVATRPTASRPAATPDR